jgi:hypothetical protein
MENLKELIDNNYGILIHKETNDEYSVTIFKHPFVPETVSYRIIDGDYNAVMEVLQGLDLNTVEETIKNYTGAETLED